MKNLNFDGLWIYTWLGSDDEVGAKDIWNYGDINLNKLIKTMERE